MPLLVVALGYLLGAVPAAYIAGRMLKGVDVRRVGDGNMGAANVFRQVGPAAGIAVGLADAGKGYLAVLLAQTAGVSQIAILAAGAAAVAGHNWPVFLGFRGGRGLSTTIGVLLVLLPQPMLITAVPALPALLITRNVSLSAAFLFVPLPLVGWWLGVPGLLVAYGMALPCLVAVTHFSRAWQRAARRA